MSLAGADRARDRRLLAIVIGLAALPPIALLVAEFVAFGDLRGFPIDDAWIHLQFARNLADGAGLSYDGGRLVAGSTAPLWTLLLSPLFLLPGPVEVWAKLLGLVAHCAAVGMSYVVARRLGLSRARAGLAAALVATTNYLLWASISGMEVPLFNVLVLAGLALHLYERRAERQGEPRPPVAFLVFGLAALARPEGLVLPLLAAADRCLRPAPGGGVSVSLTGARRALAGLALVAILVVPIAVANEVISGSPAPTTLAAKSEGPRSWMPDGRHVTRIFSFLLAGQPLPVLLATGGAAVALARLGSARDSGLLLPFWAFGLPFAMAILSSGGELLIGNFGRYLYPLFPVWILLGVLGLELLDSDRLHVLTAGRRRLIVPIVVLLLFFAPLVSRNLTAVSIYLQSRSDVERSDVAAARWLAANVPPDALLGLCDIGVIKYTLPNPIVDLAGIASPERAEYLDRMRRERGLSWAPALRLWIEEVRPEYIVLYPRWFPLLDADPVRFPVAHRLPIPNNVAMAGDELVIYATPWTRRTS